MGNSWTKAEALNVVKEIQSITHPGLPPAIFILATEDEITREPFKRVVGIPADFSDEELMARVIQSAVSLVGGQGTIVYSECYGEAAMVLDFGNGERFSWFAKIQSDGLFNTLGEWHERKIDQPPVPAQKKNQGKQVRNLNPNLN